MGPSKINTVESTFAKKLLDSNGTQHFLINKIKLSEDYEIKQIRPKHETYYYNSKTDKKAICLHFTVGNIKGDVGSLTKDGNKVSVNYVVDRQGNIYNLFNDEFWSYHLGSGTVGTNAIMSKQTIGIEISNYGPLKLTADGILNDAYGNEYCSLDDKEFYKECTYRGYDYYATMTDKQETAVALLLNYLCEQHNIPKSFKDNPDVLFKDANAAKSFKGIYLHTSVRKDKFDWPEPMITGVISKFEHKEESTNKQTVSIIVEAKEQPNTVVEEKIEIPQDSKIEIAEPTVIENKNETITVKKELSVFEQIINFLISLFGKK